jgi:hypothetical protein
MSRPLVLALAASATLLCAGAAHAGGDVSWSVGINLPNVATVISNGPAPYYEPAPVYLPQPVYVPAPVYYEPPQVVYRPVPRVYYRPAPPVYYGPATIAYVRPGPGMQGPYPARWIKRGHGGHGGYWQRGEDRRDWREDRRDDRRQHHDEYGNRFSR